jgi:hypothetical protein
MSRSNRPQVLGLVIITPAMSGPSRAVSAARSTRPSGVAGMFSMAKPAKAAVAGLVPWALSGTSMIRRVTPRLERGLDAQQPHSSPCAPALGDMATAAMPVSAISQSASSAMVSSAPRTVLRG